MTAMGSDLGAPPPTTRSGSGPRLPPTLNWTVIGAAPAAVGGLAYQSNDNSLWVATRDNRLWKFRP